MYLVARDRDEGSGLRIPARIWAAAVLFTGGVLATMPGAQAATTASNGLADLAAIQPVATCSAIPGMDFSGVTDGTVTVTSATVVTTGAAPYCYVKATISPAIAFEMRLPTQGWTQRYLQVGCGGLCGSIPNLNNPAASTGCVPVTNGQIALATTNMGHQGLNDGTWAYNNPQAIIDFAYRAQHVTAQLAKAMILRFYGQAQQYAYFDGCSDGGREALMEAQRYPEDFNGILAGAPANDLTVQNTYHHGWNVVANLDANGRPILLAAKLPLIHAAVLNACDRIDGVVDGIIEDPRRCNFNPTTLVCAAGQDPATCLSVAEAAVVQRLHDGATDANGNRLEQYIGHEWGSELDWTLFVPAAQTGTSGSQNFVLPYFRYLATQNQQNPNLTITDLQFTVPFFQSMVNSSQPYLAATDPDISAFADRGGKLILWHGWSDQHITPQGTLQYYDAVRRLLGADRADQFMRLFLFPGVGHCGGGEGPNSFDLLSQVMAWTESGIKPTKVIASRLTNGVVTRTRPVYPYPLLARYSGSGSTDDAANFSPFPPMTQPTANYEWVGKYLYAPGLEQTCTAQGTQLACTPGK